MKNVAFCLSASVFVFSSAAFAQNDDDEDQPKPKPAVVTVATPAAAPAGPHELSDHEAMVGHFAVGYMGASQIPIANYAAGAAGGGPGITQDNITAPYIGGRYWISPLLGIDVGLGLGVTSSSQTSTTAAVATTTDQPTRVGFGLHAGVPLALAYSKHFTFEVIPEITFGFATATLKATQPAGNVTLPDINLSGVRFDIGARVGGELHFGFMGVPQLSLQATIGLGFRYTGVKASASDGSASISQTATGFGTSVQDAPWAIFTDNISALYYF